MTSLREEFKKEFPAKVRPQNGEDVAKAFLLEQVWKDNVLDAMADWWTTTLKERIEAVRLEAQEHPLKVIANAHVSEMKEYNLGYGKALDTITRLLD